MNPSSLIHLPPELLTARPQGSAHSTAGAPLERGWATALALVALCAAIAFALPV